jgi:hypothetical protein
MVCNLFDVANSQSEPLQVFTLIGLGAKFKRFAANDVKCQAAWTPEAR